MSKKWLSRPLTRLEDGWHRPDFGSVTKIGRNQPCPCGKGIKYKRFCGALTPAVDVTLPAELLAGIDQGRREVEAHQRRRQQQQGLGRPIVSIQISGQRVVAVGKRLYYSTKWHTFHNFLSDYLLGSLGPEWANAEQAKPVADRHPILRWYAQAMEDAKALQVAEGMMVSGPMTGAIRAFMNLAYNIYLIAHHGDGQAMADIYLKRLKSARADDFTGALYETYAAAAFLKAGFKVAYEEMVRRSTSCVEFVATWPKTGEHFSVEVKSRVHVADASTPAEAAKSSKPLRVGAKLVKALGKAADYTRVVMIEINVPETLTDQDKLEGWAATALSQIRGNETATQPDGSLFPPAYVFVTNHSFHHDLSGTAGTMQALAAGFRIPDFGPDARYVGYAAVLAARERHSAMMGLIASIKTHYEIPATFDGELPSQLFSSSKISPLKIGHRYLVPDETGKERPGRLTSATVNRAEKLVYGAYALDDGRHVIVTAPLTSEELADYQRYPDTFFGEIVEPPGKANSLIEMCDFLFATYKHTSREKLLEFMEPASDLEDLKSLGQRDLAIIYCERMAQSMEAKQKKAAVKREEQQSPSPA